MSNGLTLYDFTRTRFGTLSDMDLQKPGNVLMFVVGMANGSSAWETVTVSETYSYRYPSPRWSGISTSFAALQLLLNPGQPRQVCRGKMGLDFSPKVTTSWLGSFLDTWSRFIQFNPQVCYFNFNTVILYNLVITSIYSSKSLICLFLMTEFIMVVLVSLHPVIYFLVFLVYRSFSHVLDYVFPLLLEKF